MIVCQHGLHGETYAFSEIQRIIRSKHPDKYLFYIPHLSRSETHDGIDYGGAHLAKLIKHVTKQHSIRRISFIGHSLGTLYIRYAIHILWKEEWFSKSQIEPYFYISLAGPHLGVIPQISVNYANKTSCLFSFRHSACQVITTLIVSLLGKTGEQLVCIDKEKLLQTMTSDEYISSLRCFSYRILFCNSTDDLIVPMYSSSINYNGGNVGKMAENLNKIEWIRYVFSIKNPKPHGYITRDNMVLEKITDILQYI